MAAVAVWVLRGSPAEDAAPVVAPAALPVPEATSAPQIAAPSPPVTAAPSLAGLKLRGLIVRPGSPSAAIIETADGQQRLVRSGGQVTPGVSVESVGGSGVVIVAGGQRQTLAFDAGLAARADSAPPAVQPGSTRPSDATSADYRIGLKAQKSGATTRGYAVVDISRLPLLRRAGLQAGDIIVSINGSGLQSDEKLIELPQEIRSNTSVEVIFERDGRQKKTVIPVDG